VGKKAGVALEAGRRRPGPGIPMARSSAAAWAAFQQGDLAPRAKRSFRKLIPSLSVFADARAGLLPCLVCAGHQGRESNWAGLRASDPRYPGQNG